VEKCTLGEFNLLGASRSRRRSHEIPGKERGDIDENAGDKVEGRWCLGGAFKPLREKKVEEKRLMGKDHRISQKRRMRNIVALGRG